MAILPPPCGGTFTSRRFQPEPFSAGKSFQMKGNVRYLLISLLVLAMAAFWLYYTVPASPADTVRPARSPAPQPPQTAAAASLPRPAPAPAAATAVDFSTLPRLSRKDRVVEAIRADRLADVLADWEQGAGQSPEAAYQLAHALFYCFMAHDSVESVEHWVQMSEAGYRKDGDKSDAEIAHLTGKIRRAEMRKHLYCRGLSSKQIERHQHWLERAANAGIAGAQEWLERRQHPAYDRMATEATRAEYCARQRASLTRGSVGKVLDFAVEQRLGGCPHRDADLEQMALMIAVAHASADTADNNAYRVRQYDATRHLGPVQQQTVYDQAARLLHAWQENGGAWDEVVEIQRMDHTAESQP